MSERTAKIREFIRLHGRDALDDSVFLSAFLEDRPMPPLATTWACTACNALNPLSINICGVCGLRRYGGCGGCGDGLK